MSGREPSTINAVRFSVRDTGIGIPQDRIDRLFHSFSQVDSSTARKYGGTGLGLAISKRLSEIMGGAMWVESEGVPGKGSTFYFNILAEPAPPVKSRDHFNAGQHHLQGKRLLVVDDNATNRRILTLQTQAWGVQVTSTASPREGLELIQKGEPFDIAILDMPMPRMEGFVLAQEIRLLRDAQPLPLVLFSSLGRREVGAESADFAGYLTKPLKQSQLFDALVSIITGEALKPKSARQAPAPVITGPEMAQQNPLRILLVEDNLVNQRLALRLLQQMGYRADLAANGLEAIEAVNRQQYDVVLMDVQMPEMDGLEATRRIRKAKSFIQPRIVAMTANAMQGDREMCLAAGMDDYINKPIRTDELVGALREASPVN